MYLWHIMSFPTEARRDNYIRKNKHRIEYHIVYFDNCYGIEYRKLRKIG